MTPPSFAFLFPGQGAQSIGMGYELTEKYPIAKKIFSQANEILGFDLSGLMWQGPEEALSDTINTQPALLVHSIAALNVYRELFPHNLPMLTAGHSMGELSALVACGALSFEDTLHLARKRGELMKSAGEHSPGGMAAVLGLDIPTLDELCQKASIGDEVVQVANDNCPGQVVISGTNAAIETAITLAKDAGARRIRSLAVSIAAHSPLMAYAQDEFNRAVEESPLIDPSIPVIGNVTASKLTSADQLRSDLQAQLTSRVRWTETIQTMIRDGVTTFIELGNGSVLTGLLKRIDENVSGYAAGGPGDFDKISQVGSE